MLYRTKTEQIDDGFFQLEYQLDSYKHNRYLRYRLMFRVLGLIVE